MYIYICIVYVHISNLRMCGCFRVCTGACDCVFLNVEGKEGGGGGGGGKLCLKKTNKNQVKMFRVHWKTTLKEIIR